MCLHGVRNRSYKTKKSTKICFYCVRFFVSGKYIHISNQTGLVSEIYLCLRNNPSWLHAISLAYLIQTPSHRAALLAGQFST